MKVTLNMEKLTLVYDAYHMSYCTSDESLSVCYHYMDQLRQMRFFPNLPDEISDFVPRVVTRHLPHDLHYEKGMLNVDKEIEYQMVYGWRGGPPRLA